jgi:signal transduction histidine kinase
MSSVPLQPSPPGAPGSTGVLGRPFDAAELLREAVEISRPLARVKSLSLTLAIPDAPLRATADRDRLLQVLSHLLSNAIKFSSAKGQIVVQAMTLGRGLQIAIHDDGPGIPERDLEQVFDCFFQSHDSDARGLGLGLSISRGIIQEHRGRMWATSWPGTGSTFYFTVPGLPSMQAPTPIRGATSRAAMA